MRSLPDHAQEELTRTILRAAVDQRSWQDVVDALHAASGGVQFDLVCATPEGDAYALFDGGGDPNYIRSYGDYYFRINPWAARWSKAPAGIVFTSPAILDRAELLRTEFYADWARLQENLIGGAGVILSSRGGHSFMLGATVRARRVETDEANCAQLLRSLLPLLRGAVEISSVMAARELDLLGARRHAAAEASLFALSAKGRIAAFNGAGALMLASPTGLVREGPGGQLVATDVRLEEMVRGLPSSGGAARPRLRSIRLGAGQEARGAHLVVLEPEAAAGLSVGWFGERTLASHLLIIEPPGAAADREGKLAATLRLTPAEAAVVVGLADGLGLGEIAEARRLSIHTVRNQLKAAMAKAGVRRQAELVRTVGGLLP